MQMGLRLGLHGRLMGGVSAYAVAGLDPELVLDFASDTYRVDGASSTFSSAVNYAQAVPTLMTMTDSDGLLKWAPHNLLTYSEDLTGTGWAVANATIDDSETISLTATTAASLSSPSGTTVAGAGYTVEAEIWSETDAGEFIDIGFSTNNLSNTFSSPIELTTTPTLYSFSKANNTATQNGFRMRNQDGLAKVVKVRNVRIYRSDLGGMVANPDRGDSYVPTTTAAVYMPRRGNHVYNGTSWVNRGLLLESEERTNLVTYSQDFTNAWWAKANTATLAIDATGPDGETSAVTFVDSGAGGTGLVSVTSTTLTVSTSSAYTASVFAKADGLSFLHIRATNFTTPSNGGAYFNLATGAVDAEDTGFSGGIEDMGGGWYRCYITFTTDASDTTGNIAFYPASAASFAGLTVDLDGTSSILIYGAQFE